MSPLKKSILGRKHEELLLLIVTNKYLFYLTPLLN